MTEVAELPAIKPSCYDPNQLAEARKLIHTPEAQAKRSASLKAYHAKRKAERVAEEAARTAPKPEAKPEQPKPDPFVRERIARVEQQVERIDGLIDAEVDPKRLRDLAAARGDLLEQRRVLRGQPLPGSLRPTASGKASNPLFGDQTPGV